MEDSMRAILLCAAVLSLSATAGPPAKTVDLDRAGALDSIERQDKPLYERIVGVLRAAEMEPCDTLPKIVQAQFRGSLESCNGYTIFTSYPAKIRVAFRIDETLYTSFVIQPKITAQSRPALEVTPGPAPKR
jgi:hypothetical protein